MRYLVISACEDVRSGVQFDVGDEFLPEPDLDQAERLMKAGCLRPISDGVPLFSGTDATTRELTDLREKLERSDGAAAGLNDRIAALTAQHEAVVAEAKDLRAELTAATEAHAVTTTERDGLAVRVGELQTALEEATRPATDGGTGEQQPSKPGKAKG